MCPNRNEYEEYFLGGKGSQFVRLTILPPPAHANCLEMWEPQPPGGLTILPPPAHANCLEMWEPQPPVGLTILPPPAHANCLEMWQPQPPGTHKACTGIALHFTNMVPTVL